MASYNKVTVIGRLTRDVELRYTPGGTAVADISIAINEKSKGKETAVFVSVTVWDKTAELCAEYLAKGREALFEARLKMDEWNDKTTGEKRTKLGLVADKVVFLGGREPNHNDSGASNYSAPSGNSQPAASGQQGQLMEPQGEVPF